MAIRASILAAGGEVHFGAKVSELLIADTAAPRCPLRRRTRDHRRRRDPGHRPLGARHLSTCLPPSRPAARAEALRRRSAHRAPATDDRSDPVPPAARRTTRPTPCRPRVTDSPPRSAAAACIPFCMCPGGFIVPTATENDEVVVNGMSLSRRDSPFANSGMVVGVEPEDFADLFAQHGPLAGLAFQQELEHAAKSAGGGGQVAPAQRIDDFLASRASRELPPTSYFPGVAPCRLDQLLPAPIAARLRAGLEIFGRRIHGYTSAGGLMVAWNRAPAHRSACRAIRHPRAPRTARPDPRRRGRGLRRRHRQRRPRWNARRRVGSRILGGLIAGQEGSGNSATCGA